MCYLSLEQLAMRITEGMTLSKAKKTIMYLPVLGTVTCLQWWPFFDAIWHRSGFFLLTAYLVQKLPSQALTKNQNLNMWWLVTIYETQEIATEVLNI